MPSTPPAAYRFATCAVASLMQIAEDRARLIRVQLVAPDVHDLNSARGVVQVWSGGGWVEVFRSETMVRSGPRVEPRPVASPVDPREVEVRMRVLADFMRAEAQRILDHRQEDRNASPVAAPWRGGTGNDPS